MTLETIRCDFGSLSFCDECFPKISYTEHSWSFHITLIFLRKWVNTFFLAPFLPPFIRHLFLLIAMVLLREPKDFVSVSSSSASGTQFAPIIRFCFVLFCFFPKWGCFPQSQKKKGLTQNSHSILGDIFSTMLFLDNRAVLIYNKHRIFSSHQVTVSHIFWSQA